jgi:hypothetical protein
MATSCKKESFNISGYFRIKEKQHTSLFLDEYAVKPITSYDFN